MTQKTLTLVCAVKHDKQLLSSAGKKGLRLQVVTRIVTKEKELQCVKSSMTSIAALISRQDRFKTPSSPHENVSQNNKLVD